MADLRLLERDKELLRALTRMCHLCSPFELARYWGTSIPNATRRLEQLTKNQFLRVHTANLPRFVPPVTLIASGPPHWDQSPGRLSYRLRERWLALSWRRTKYYTSSRKTAAYFGLALPQLEKPKLAHDAGLAAVAFYYLSARPEEARLWRNEGVMAHTRISATGVREKLPDAFIVDANERVSKVIEFATASYDSIRIRAFVEDCVQRDLPWEIWG